MEKDTDAGRAWNHELPQNSLPVGGIDPSHAAPGRPGL